MATIPKSRRDRIGAGLWRLGIVCISMACASFAQEQNWTHFVRIGAYGLKIGNADTIVRDSRNTHVFGIEVDNDITGR